MFRILSNATFQRAVSNAAVKLIKVGAMTVFSVWLSKTTHEAGKNLIADVIQDYRLIRHETALKEA